MARLPYVDLDSARLEVREVFRKLEKNRARILNLYRIFGHSPAVLLPIIRTADLLLTKAALDRKLQEIVILRTAVLHGAQYEWRQHVPMARHAGVSEVQIDAVAHWESSSTFDERERAVLRYADELAKTGDVTDETFARVSGFLNEREIVELTASAVFWGAMARFMLAVRVDVEEEGMSDDRTI